MAILKIARMGHPVLLRPAEPMAAGDLPQVRKLVADMAETLADAGGVGLAAPQVHESRRVLIYLVPAERGGEPRPLTALINPVIEPVPGPPVLGWEGCLSIPGLRAAVPRHRAIRWSGLDINGEPVSGVAHGFHARVIQHEVDHLDGVLYPMRMSDFRLMGFGEEIQRFGSPLEGEG